LVTGDRYRAPDLAGNRLQGLTSKATSGSAPPRNLLAELIGPGSKTGAGLQAPERDW